MKGKGWMEGAGLNKIYFKMERCVYIFERGTVGSGAAVGLACLECVSWI